MANSTDSSKRKDIETSEDGKISIYTGQAGTLTSNKRLEDTNHLIPHPGYNGVPPEKYDPLLMRLPIIVGAPFVLLLLGLGLEVVNGLSHRWNGFRVPVSSTFGIFGNISSQFLASFIPTLFIIPNAVLWRELDWMIRMYQPYIVLSEGNANAEESVLLNYVEIGPILSIPRALKYKHRLVFVSAFTAALTYLFQPFTGSVFQIREIPNSFSWDAMSLDTVAHAPDIGTLEAFVAGAGYADASVLHDLPDPKFVSGGWSTARFTFPANPLLNATLTVDTIGIRSIVNCSNPVTDQLAPATGTSFTLSATSVTGCSHNVTFDPSVVTLQYGVDAVACPSSNGVLETQVDFQPVMFWFFHIRSDTNQPEAQAIFCTPRLTGNSITVISDVKTGNIMRVTDNNVLIPSNDVVNGSQVSQVYNGVVFTPSTNPFIQARASATNSLVPAAILRNMTQQPGGLDATFSKPNGALDATVTIYTRHLSLSAQSVYFVPGNSTLPGSILAQEPRLVVDPFPAHFLAIILILTGILGITIHVLHRNQRKQLRLAAEPGTIASVTALTARSGFGTLLTPYDSELTMEKRLEGLRFSFDKRTGAIVAEGEAVNDFDRNTLFMPSDDTRTSLLKATTPPLSASFPTQQLSSPEPWSLNSREK